MPTAGRVRLVPDTPEEHGVLIAEGLAFARDLHLFAHRDARVDYAKQRRAS